MIRVCPHSDSKCPNGMACTFSCASGDYDGTKRVVAPSQTPEAAGLDRCPFCDGEAWLNDYEAKYSDLPPKSRAPQCRSCGASLGYLATPAKATKAWNHRVTAASAQAAIDALKARVAELEAAKWEVKHVDTMNDMVAMGLARDAAEARADRLAKALEALNAERKREGVNLAHLKRAVAVAYADMNRAALQQETQP